MKWVPKKFDHHGYLLKYDENNNPTKYDENGYRVEIDQEGVHHKYDEDGNGTLCAKEFCNLLTGEIKEHHSEEAAMYLFNKIDTDGDDAIS